jgi:serine/threonine protein kinase/WD40 repeat protein
MAPSSDAKCIFGKALELPAPADRAAYLDQACGDNAALRSEVAGLLRALEKAGHFMSHPAFKPLDGKDDDTISERPGTVIGPYKLMERIGEGGMGLVFVAEQQQPVRRKVALKVIKPGMDTREVIARFEAERQALALMDHPNIAHVLDAGSTPSDRPYFVMELVRGVPITEFCDANRLTLRERLKLFIDVCNAVQHAHQKGLIHRDLKASNIMITLHDGTPVVKVIDFGVAKAIGQQLTEKTIYTRFTEMIGTPLYMSPEQAEMSGLDIDTRSDIYSLGVLLYELLTGTTPFDTERLRTAAFDEMRRIIREEEPPRPSKRISTLASLECGGSTPLSSRSSADSALDRPDAENRESRCAAKESGVKPAHSTNSAAKPAHCKDLKTIAAQRRTEPRKLSQLFRGELDWIVMKALEKDRKMRYETASAFAADVLRYLHDERVLACPPTLAYQVRKFVRRNRKPVAAASLLLLALVVGVVGTTWQMTRATAARAVAVNEAKQKEAALRAAQDSERDAKEQLFAALLNQAQARRFSRQMGQRLDSLAALAKAAEIGASERLRDEAIAAMALPDVRRVPGWRSNTPGTTVVAYGADYRIYARADTQGIISIRTIPDDQEIQHIASGRILATYLQHFSPDDRFFVCLGEGYTLHAWRVADAQRALRDELSGCRSYAFSPDGRQLVVGQDKSVVCFNLATGQESIRWALSATAHSLAFDPACGKLAVGYLASNVVSVYDAAIGALLADLPVGAMSNQVVAWHPDGERLAVAGSAPRIEIWNVAAKRKLATLEGHVQDVPELTFHPEGSLLASHSWDGTLRLWDAATGRPLLQLPLAAGALSRFSGDGRWLGGIPSGERTELLEVTPSREYRTIVSSAGVGQHTLGNCDVSPDGRLLAVGTDHGARLWDLRSGRELAGLPTGTNFCFFHLVRRSGDDTADPTTPPVELLTAGSRGLLRWPITSEAGQSRRAATDSTSSRDDRQHGETVPWNTVAVGSELNEWPRAADGPPGQRLLIGPPEVLSPRARFWFALPAGGGTLGVVTEEGGAGEILDLVSGKVRQELGVHAAGGEVWALSGDGRWAANCGWQSDRVRLWNADTGEMVHEWVVGKPARVCFTPDSRALIISRGDEFSFWDVETFQPIRRLRRDVAQYPGLVAFSPDGELMALEMAPGTMHLMETATGRTVAKLEDPHGDRATWQSFTPDGTQLVVVAKYSRAMHVWDLRAIRTRLKAMNLDWNWPEFGVRRLDAALVSSDAFSSPRENPHSETYEKRRQAAALQNGDGPITIDVDLGHLAKPVLTRQQKTQQRIERMRRELEASPDRAQICNNLAWALATAPESLRSVEEAVTLAETAVRLNPEKPTYRNTLGVAYYRAGRYRDAVQTLEPNLQAQQDWGLAFDLYFLAMSHHRLGEPARARDYYELAVRWSQTQQTRSAEDAEELSMFRAEAEQVLEVRQQSSSQTPSDEPSDKK